MKIMIPQIEGRNLVEVIKEKKRELESLETQLEMFKLTALKTIEGMGLESIRKDGWQFTVVKPERKVIDDAIAFDIIEQAGEDTNNYFMVDKVKFIGRFGEDNKAVSKIEGSKYLKISEMKK